MTNADATNMTYLKLLLKNDVKIPNDFFVYM